MNKEIWKDIPGYEGLYQISNFGRVMALNFHYTGKPGLIQLKIGHDKSSGKITVFATLCKDGIVHMYSVHRLVALAFLPNPDNLPDVHHKDKNRLNNNVDNLMRVSKKEHAILDGKNKSFGLFDKDNNLIKVYYSTRDVVGDGFTRSIVMKCLHGKRNGLYKDHYFRYIE